jgi:hypothetical protein
MREPDHDLPTGTVTFLFSDIEGSTELVQRLDPQTYRDLLEQHNRLLRTAFWPMAASSAAPRAMPSWRSFETHDRRSPPRSRRNVCSRRQPGHRVSS